MKPVIITLNSNGKVVMSVEEFKRHMDSAYNQGYSDGQSTTITTPYYGNQKWWYDVTCNGTALNTTASVNNKIEAHISDVTGSTTEDFCDCVSGYCNCDTGCANQVSIKDYIKNKGE